MKYLAVFFVIFVTAKASIIGISPLVATGSVIKGASAAGAVVGADGAVLTAVDGATVVGLAPIRPAIASAVVGPHVIAAGPSILAAPPAVVAAAPATSAVIAGPSGTIAASTGAAVGVAPLLTRTVVATPAVASASAYVAPAVNHLGHLGLGHGLIL